MRLLTLGGLLLIFMATLSCSPFSSQKTSTIVIAVENFSEQDFLCSDTQFLKTLDAVAETCENLIRFTHFFASSDSTQSNLASLMSASDFHQHGVRHNGPQYLPASTQTLAELSLKKGLRTALFSGGIPLLQKWGIDQGFEIFDDGFDRKMGSHFRSFKDSVEKSFRWMDEEIGSRPIFLTFYVPDLIHKDFLIKSEWEEERPVNRISKIQDIHTSVNQLILGLKARQRWENTNLILLGLSGEPIEIDSRHSLSSTHFHVPLQIKLAQGVQFNLKDYTSHLISFSDLGRWLNQMVQIRPSQKKTDIKDEIKSHTITHEAFKKKWLAMGRSPEFGFRTKQYLFNLGPETKVYDSFIDKKELDPLDDQEAQKVVEQLDRNQIRFVVESEYCLFKNHPIISKLEFDIPLCEFSKRKTNEEIQTLVSWHQTQNEDVNNTQLLSIWVQEAIERKSKVLAGWLAYQSLQQKNWSDLFELGKNFKNSSWMGLAQLNLKEPPSKGDQGCLAYFQDTTKVIEDFYKYCQDSQLRKVVEGIKTLRSKKKPSSQFWAEISNIIESRKAKELNLRMDFINDVHRPFEFNPTLSELYFFLPENREFLKLING